VDTIDRDQRIRAEAAAWLAHLQGDVASPDREKFVDWLRESHLHVAEMMRVSHVHGALERFEHWSKISDGQSEEAENLNANVVHLRGVPPDQRGAPSVAATDEPAVTDGGRRRPLIYALAASVSAVTIVFLLQGMAWKEVRTQRGERREVALADGSNLRVAPESLLKIKLEDNERRVILERGQVLFKVAKDPNRPFLVTAEDTTVRAIGTQFGVERRKQQIVVTVAEGRVGVVGAGATSARPSTSPGSPEGGTTQEIALDAGEQLSLPLKGSRADRPAGVQKVDTNRELAWADGRLVFDNATVAEVVEEFNRYNLTQLHIADTALSGRRVTGVFNATEPESFVVFMDASVPVKVIRSGDSSITIQQRQ